LFYSKGTYETEVVQNLHCTAIISAVHLFSLFEGASNLSLPPQGATEPAMNQDHNHPVAASRLDFEE